jgi:hypothetical protein
MAKKPKLEAPDLEAGAQDSETQVQDNGEVETLAAPDPIQGLREELATLRKRVDAMAHVMLQNYGQVI